MQCIICHNDTTIPKILAMHTRCNKGFIAYHKSNGITTMRKHIEFEHSALLKKLLEDATNVALKFPLNHGPSKKRAHVSCSFFNFWFFLYY
jgi:hypothetical protein